MQRRFSTATPSVLTNKKLPAPARRVIISDILFRFNCPWVQIRLAVSGLRPASETPPIHRNDLDLGQIDVLKAANVDRRRRLSGGFLALTEGRAAAVATEAMPDGMRVEGIGGKALLSTKNGQGPQRHEGQEISLPAAMGAIAFERLLKIGLDLVRHLAAMT
jgi:hypothetical protein